MIDEGLVALLAGESTIAALLAKGSAASIYQDVLPEDESLYPCIGYQFVGGQSDPTLTVSGPDKARVQIDCWGKTAEDAKKLARAVFLFLDGQTGILADSDHTSLLTAWPLHPGIDFFGDDSRYFRRMLEFYLLYESTS